MSTKNHIEEMIKRLTQSTIDLFIYKGLLPKNTTIYNSINGTKTYTLPSGDGQLSLWDWNKVADEIATVNEDMSCKHEWVNVGFHFDKWVCKKCDANKGSNE